MERRRRNQVNLFSEENFSKVVKRPPSKIDLDQVDSNA